jgi:predicted ribosome quality control (RQC) complex YloA/Tae2 family protein
MNHVPMPKGLAIYLAKCESWLPRVPTELQLTCTSLPEFHTEVNNAFKKVRDEVKDEADKARDQVKREQQRAQRQINKLKEKLNGFSNIIEVPKDLINNLCGIIDDDLLNSVGNVIDNVQVKSEMTMPT